MRQVGVEGGRIESDGNGAGAVSVAQISVNKTDTYPRLMAAAELVCFQNTNAPMLPIQHPNSVREEMLFSWRLFA